MKLGQIIDIVTGNIIRKYFQWLGGLGPKSRPFIIFQPTTIYQKPILMSLCIFAFVCNAKNFATAFLFFFFLFFLPAAVFGWIDKSFLTNFFWFVTCNCAINILAKILAKNNPPLPPTLFNVRFVLKRVLFRQPDQLQHWVRGERGWQTL